MTTLPAVVRIIDLPAATTVTGGEFVEAIQTVGGTSISVQMPISSIMSTGFGALPTGGATGQLLSKLSGTNYSATWSSVVSFVAVNAASSLVTSGSVTSIVVGVASGGIGSTQLGANAVQSSNVTTNAIGNAQFRQGTGLSVVGVAGNATSNVADIVASAPGQVLQVNAGGTGILFTTVTVGSSFLGINNTGLFNQFGTTLATGTFGIAGTTLVTGLFGVVGTSQFTGAFNVVGTTLVTGVFGQVGTSLMTGLFQVVGTSNFTGVHNVNGTTLFTSGAFGVVGTATFTGSFTQVGTSTMTGTNNLNGPLNVIGTTLITGVFGQVGTSTMTGAFNVVGTASFTGVHNVNGTTLFTSGTFGVVGTALFTSNAFGVVGTTILTGTLALGNLVTGYLVAGATGVISGTTVAAGANFVLLNTLSPSAVASAVDTTSLTSAFSNYMVVFDGVNTNTANTFFQMLVATTGTAWITTSYISMAQVNVSSVIITDTHTSLLLLSGTRATALVQTATIYGVNGFIKLYGVTANTNQIKFMTGQLTYLGAGGGNLTTTLAQANVNGYYFGQVAWSGLNFQFNGQTIATGVIKIYGMT